MEKLSFVIPCYNSENTIRDVVKEIEEMLSQHKDYSHEIILVSDASPDRVYQVIESLVAENEHMIGIELSKNFGQHAALMAGYRLSSGDIIISIDDDGQTPVDEVFSLIEALHEGNDVVYASYPEIKQSAFRRVGSKINALMLERLMGKQKGLQTNSFYACKRYIMDEILKYENSYPYLTGLVLRSTRHISCVPVNHRARTTGQSNYSIGKLFSLWLNGATAFSIAPLRLAMVLGAVCAVAGFVLVLAIAIYKLFNPAVPVGYSSMMAALLFIGGMIMIMLGVIGEYVGRTYIIQNKAPQYVVRRKAERNQ